MADGSADRLTQECRQKIIRTETLVMHMDKNIEIIRRDQKDLVDSLHAFIHTQSATNATTTQDIIRIDKHLSTIPINIVTKVDILWKVGIFGLSTIAIAVFSGIGWLISEVVNNTPTL